MTAYDEVMAFVRETEALGEVAGRLGWDQETMMPRGAAPQRAEEMAAMEAVLHARRTDARLGDLLSEAQAPDEVGAAQLRLIRRSHARATKVPAALAKELARVTSLAQGEWAEARKASDVGAFLARQGEVLRLRREQAAALADGTDLTLYDALLEGYEPEMTADEIAAIFARLRVGLVALRERIDGSTRQPAEITGHFPEAAQREVSDACARAFGYDRTHGRIDLAVHPFSSGSGLDVRITTRTDPAFPLDCIYSTIHEVGHACYEQGIDPAFLLTPVGQGVSMGVHESQSRIYENQLGRGRAFCGWLFEQMQARFGAFGIDDADAFYAAVNRVSPGYIRTEADEVHYNLHIMLRFDLERALIAGDLEVEDLEAAWNTRFEADFGVAVDTASNGVLQDVHWPVGLFGYFPTYALGNVYAGCLFEALRRDVPDWEAALASGDAGPAVAWLRARLQQFGGLRTPQETVAHATGQAPSEGPLLTYLEEKFGALYGL